jgi:ubiquinone/menaquinone biosynthesis C-methylase UbiE
MIMADSSTPAVADVAAHFRRDAPQDAHQRRRHRAVLALIQGLDGRVLDYGCGYGDLTWAISRTHPDVTGVDVEPERIAFARREYPELRFAVCDKGTLDFPDASFDIVTSVVVLPFVPDPAAYLREVRRVLRPGGHLIVATKTSALLQRAWRRLRHGRGASDVGSRGLTQHSLDAIATLLGQEGFSVVRRTAFFDAPFSNHKNATDIVNGCVEWVAECLHVVSAAPYPLILARRTETQDAAQPARAASDSRHSHA